jgi:hypothetical protein
MLHGSDDAFGLCWQSRSRSCPFAVLAAVAMCLVTGCGDSTRKPPDPPRATHSRTVAAAAKMRIVSPPGALPIVEKGTLAGAFPARLTVTVSHTGVVGAESKHFDIQTAEGSISGVANLTSYTLGSPLVGYYHASIAAGTGVFDHVSSEDLVFRTESSGLPGAPHPKVTITVTGTLSY